MNRKRAADIAAAGGGSVKAQLAAARAEQRRLEADAKAQNADAPK